MKDKKAFIRKIGDFLAGKGFYVVLLVCTAVIGISAWILLSAGNLTDTMQPEEIAGVSEPADDAMVSPDNGIADALNTDNAGSASPAPSPSAKPSAKPSALPTATPTEDTPKKDTASNAEDAEEAMSKPLVFVWPVMGDIAVMYATDELIYNETMEDWRTHDGVDIAAMLGAKVMAAADGTVVEIYEDDLLGTTVVIDHGKGLQSLYANLARIPAVETGDTVAMGAVIGSVGYTAIGESAGESHLHFAMTQDGVPVDPSAYLPRK